MSTPVKAVCRTIGPFILQERSCNISGWYNQANKLHTIASMSVSVAVCCLSGQCVQDSLLLTVSCSNVKVHQSLIQVEKCAQINFVPMRESANHTSPTVTNSFHSEVLSFLMMLWTYMQCYNFTLNFKNDFSMSMLSE